MNYGIKFEYSVEKNELEDAKICVKMEEAVIFIILSLVNRKGWGWWTIWIKEKVNYGKWRIKRYTCWRRRSW